MDCGEDHRFGVWGDLWGRQSNLQKGRDLGLFPEESASCEKPTICVKAGMLTAVQRAGGLVAPQAELWTAVGITALGCGVTFGEDSQIYKKGVTSDFFSENRRHVRNLLPASKR